MLRSWQKVQAHPACRIVGHILSKAVATVGRHPALFLSLPSLYLLLVYPPLWKDVDALGQLIWQPGWANILHYPPLYCFTGRIPFWLGDCIHAVLSGQSIPAPHLFAGQHPSWLGIEMLIIAQHAGLIAALTLLVRTAAHTPLGRGAIALSCVAASSLYAQQQCAGSEASSVSAVILLSVAGLWVYRRILARDDVVTSPTHPTELTDVRSSGQVLAPTRPWDDNTPKRTDEVPPVSPSSTNSAALPGDLSPRLRTSRSSSVAGWIAYTVALLIAFGTRHINYALVLWLPLALAARLLWHRSPGRRLSRPVLISLAIALACGAFALVTDTLIVRVMIVQSGEQYRTDLGFVLIDRVSGFLYKVPNSERAAMVDKLIAGERDPIVQVAIKAEGNLLPSHEELADTIQDALRHQGVPPATIQARSDVAVFNASLAYLRTFHPKLIDMILSDFLHGYVREDNGKLSLNRFLANRTAARMREQDPKSWKSLDQLHSIDSQQTASALVDRASSDLYLMFWSPIPTIFLILLNIGLTVALVRRNLRHIAWLAQALLLTSAILYFVNCICDYFNDRYALPVLVCGISAFALQIGALIDATFDSTEPERAGRGQVAQSLSGSVISNQ
jgi:hypothetical protein